MLCKEILNNIIKHAYSTHIEVSVVRINNKLLIDILHNGQGIDNNQIKDLISQNKGIGLKSIFSRAQLTGSIVNYYVNSNESKVTIETPIT
jgi:signal transduction histidine kinase